MRLETESSLLVYMGPAQSMPGDLWTLVHPDGEDTRTFLFDSAFEAQIFAQHFRAELSLSMPAVLDPRRAMDYANIMDKLMVPRAGLGFTNDMGHRTKVSDLGFDRLRGEDVSTGMGGS